VATPVADTTYTATFTQSFLARVNFQATTSQGFAGYVADTGQVFGNRGSGTTTADGSSTGNNGTLVGGVTWVAGRNAAAGTALSFNGSTGAVTLANSLAGVLGGTGTVAFWIRTTQVGNNTMWQAPGVLGVESAGNGNDVFWGWLDATGRIGIMAGNTAGAKSTNPINDGQWHHVALTRNAATGVVQVFADGVLNASATSETGVKTTPFASLGRIEDTGGTPMYFNGTLDDVRVFNRVLTASEIAGLMA
jgi:MSHA biogenesis protein MshQ